MILDISKLQESLDYDKQLLYTKLRLYIENEEAVKIKLIKSFDKRDHSEIYDSTESLYQMSEFLQIDVLQRKLRDLQSLALHKNLNQPLAEKLKETVISLLTELEEEINYILNDQKGI